MKMTAKPKRLGFTLVELLVVIVIIAALAAVALTIGRRMLAKGKATESLQNMRQISPLLTTYASEHSNSLPAIRGPVKIEDGSTPTLQWNEVVLNLIYPDTNRDDFKAKSWWNTNSKCVLRNPMFKDGKGWAPLNPGYAMNQMIAENIMSAREDNPGSSDPLEFIVPMAVITNPAKTPLIAPYTNYYFTFDDSQLNGFKKGAAKDLIMEGKIPVVFIDGHTEMITPSEYTDRELSKMPLPAATARP